MFKFFKVRKERQAALFAWQGKPVHLNPSDVRIVLRHLCRLRTIRLALAKPDMTRVRRSGFMSEVERRLGDLEARDLAVDFKRSDLNQLIRKVQGNGSMESV